VHLAIAIFSFMEARVNRDDLTESRHRSLTPSDHEHEMVHPCARAERRTGILAPIGAGDRSQRVG
jgi:hypothetical protein